jgi:DNA integrity scanning protein DisA with diadenylate cyclase activity
MIEEWRLAKSDATEIHINSDIFSGIKLPEITSTDALGILKEDIERIGKGRVYPDGLTATKIAILRENGFASIGELMASKDENILALDGIGEKTVKKIRELCYQAVWM